MKKQQNSKAVVEAGTKPETVSAPEREPVTRSEILEILEIMMHKDVHGDEIVGGALARSSVATEYLPGVATAVINFIERDIPGDDQMFDAAKKLPIGCGGNTRFNDHRGPDGRINGECSATLVAKFIEVDGLPQYKRLLDETLWCDTHAGTSRTQFSEIVKSINRHLRGNSLRVFMWGEQAVDAIIEREKWAYAAVTSELSLMNIFSTFKRKLEKAEGSGPILDRIEDAVRKSEASGLKLVTELSYIVGALSRRLDPNTRKPVRKTTDVIEWCELVFEAMYHEQVEFQKEFDRLTKGEHQYRTYEVQALLEHRDESLKLMSFQSESRAALKVALRMGADIILVRDSQGHARINTRKGIRGLNLADVTRMMRLLESQAHLNPKKKGSWTKLGKGGEHEDAPGWYHDVQAKALYIGTETHDSIPSGIATQAMVEVLLFGFYPEAVLEWCRGRNVSLNRDKNGELFWAMGRRFARSERRAPAEAPIGKKPARRAQGKREIRREIAA